MYIPENRNEVLEYLTESSFYSYLKMNPEDFEFESSIYETKFHIENLEKNYRILKRKSFFKTIKQIMEESRRLDELAVLKGKDTPEDWERQYHIIVDKWVNERNK